MAKYERLNKIIGAELYLKKLEDLHEGKSPTENPMTLKDLLDLYEFLKPVAEKRNEVQSFVQSYGKKLDNLKKTDSGDSSELDEIQKTVENVYELINRTVKKIVELLKKWYRDNKLPKFIFENPNNDLQGLIGYGLILDEMVMENEELRFIYETKEKQKKILEELFKEVEEKRKTLAQLNKEIEKKKEETNNLTKRQKDLENEVNKLTNKEEELNKSIEVETKKQQHMDQKTKDTVKEVKRVTGDVKKIIKELKKNVKKTKKLNTKPFVDKYNELEDYIKRRKSRANSLREEVLKLTSERDSVKASISLSESNKKSLELSIEGLKAKRDQVEKERNKLRNEIPILKGLEKYSELMG